MEGQLLLDPAEVGDLLEVRVGFLIRQDREELTISIRLVAVLRDDCSRDVEKQHVGFHARFLSLGHDPLLVVHRHDVVGREVGHVDVSQSGEAGKDEDVPHQLQSLDTQILVGYSKDLFVRQKASIYWLHVEAEIDERIMVENAELSPEEGNRLERLQRLSGRVVRLPDGCPKV